MTDDLTRLRGEWGRFENPYTVALESEVAALEQKLAEAREQLRLANIDWANTEAEAATLRRMLDALYDIFMEGVEPEEPEEYRILMMLRARAVAKDGDA